MHHDVLCQAESTTAVANNCTVLCQLTEHGELSIDEHCLNCLAVSHVQPRVVVANTIDHQV